MKALVQRKDARALAQQKTISTIVEHETANVMEGISENAKFAGQVSLPRTGAAGAAGAARAAAARLSKYPI